MGHVKGYFQDIRFSTTAKWDMFPLPKKRTWAKMPARAGKKYAEEMGEAGGGLSDGGPYR
jgi:hypothetical protein